MRRSVAAAVVLAWWACGSAQGASITANPYHLALAPGQEAGSTINWSTNGSAWGEVWCSVDNGPDQLVAAGQGSGSIAFQQMSFPHIYMFKLYEGTAHSTLLAWTSVTTQLGPMGQFGVNYTLDNNWFTDGAYFTRKVRMAKDMAALSAIGSNAVRLDIWSYDGCSLDFNNHTWNFNAQFYQIIANMKHWLANYCEPHGIRVLVAFHNNWLTSTSSQGKFWWNELGMDFPTFLNRTRDWMGYIINEFEGDPVARQAIFAYDYQNEVYENTQNIWWYVTWCYDNIQVPMGRRAISNSFKDSLVDMKNNFGGRKFDYIDLHFYPLVQSQWDTLNKVDDWANTARNYWPQTTLLIGELGYEGGGAPWPNEGAAPRDENTQQTQYRSFIDAAAANNYAYCMLWEAIPTNPQTGDTISIGYEPDRPKDSWGGLGAKLGIVSNSDAESVSGGVPAGWSGTGTASWSFSSVQDAAGAATNDRYARLTVNSGSTADSGTIDLPQATLQYGGQRLYFNAFYRSNMIVKLGVREYDAGGGLIRTQWSPSFNQVAYPDYWFNSQNKLSAAWTPVLHLNTRRITCAIQGTCNGTNPSFLDIDNAAASVRLGSSPVVTTVSPVMGSAVAVGASGLLSVEVTFSRDVSAAGGDLVLNSAIWGAPSLTGFSYDSLSRKGTWTFNGLKPGTYTATLSELVVSTASNYLDGELANPSQPSSLPSGDGLPGGDAVFSFDVIRRTPDLDGDSDVDQADFGWLQSCLAAFREPPTPGCENADLSGDGYVNQTDVEVFMVCLGGANMAIPPGCR